MRCAAPPKRRVTLLALLAAACGGDCATQPQDREPTAPTILEAPDPGTAGSASILSVQVTSNGVRIGDFLAHFRPFWSASGPGDPPVMVSTSDLLALHPDGWLPEVTMATSGQGIAHLLIRFGTTPGEGAIEVSAGPLRDTVRVEVLRGAASRSP